MIGYDYVLVVPAFIDNVSEPYIPGPDDPNSLGIGVELEYQRMLDTICKAYTARWHLSSTWPPKPARLESTAGGEAQKENRNREIAATSGFGAHHLRKTLLHIREDDSASDH